MRPYCATHPLRKMARCHPATAQVQISLFLAVINEFFRPCAVLNPLKAALIYDKALSPFAHKTGLSRQDVRFPFDLGGHNGHWVDLACHINRWPSQKRHFKYILYKLTGIVGSYFHPKSKALKKNLSKCCMGNVSLCSILFPHNIHLTSPINFR